uniref:NADH-ubiquinone oxidoreductase chain 4 n=1 Tax=Olivierus martensii TaxID=34649 RepID=A7RAB9_OLIMR|nr:NADH dehydrogenase subunit 4 [Mesobuthus martensii]ABC71914.1 NADH dehydrogenase subunit 4 [Mesobuthus martensii]
MFMLLLTTLSLLFLNSWKKASLFLLLLPLLLSPMLFLPFSQHLSSFFFLDLLSFTLILLSIFISALMILSTSLLENKNSFLNITLILLFFLLLSFSSSNLMLFYISFEAVILPTFLMISFWGAQPERLKASLYLFFYTLSASLPLLVAFMFLYLKNSSLNFFYLNLSFSMKLSLFWSLLMLLAFLVKLPMFLTHLWLPKAHVEAPVAGSMILAAILLKLGGFGILRVSNFMYPLIKSLSFPIFSIALLGGILTSIICLLQTDMKALVAYSSVCHMSLLLGGAFTLSEWGAKGSLSMMISHGLCSSALFLLVTLFYNRTHTRSIFFTRGALSIFPSLMLWWFLLTSNNMAAPPSMNLFSEISLLISILNWNMLTLIPLMLISFPSASYSILLFSTPFHGSPWINCPLPNISTREYLAIFLHWLPLNLLIIKMDLFFHWL